MRSAAIGRFPLIPDSQSGKILAAIGLLSAAVLIWGYCRGPSDGRLGESSFDESASISETTAAEMAFDRSREYGVEGVLEKWIARRITFKEYALLGGERTLAFFGTPDVAPEAVVWVVSMRGEIQTQFLDQDPLTFDNFTVVLDAVSGSTHQMETFYEDYETGLRIPNSFDLAAPCQDKDRGVLEKIFQTTCPYPDDTISEDK